MRRFVLAAVMCGMTAGAHAADLSDLPILRGGITEGLSNTSVNWSGVYVGGSVSRGGADMDFTNSTQDLLTRLASNSTLDTQFDITKWPILGKNHNSGTGFGGFAGYNFQYSDVVFGVEMNYSHGSGFATSSSGSQDRQSTDSNGVTTVVTARSDASMRVNDFGSLRVRGGYAVGSFLPYAFAGVGLGQADIHRSVEVDVTYSQNGVTNRAAPLVVRDDANAHLVTGFAAGLGFDWMLCAGLFMRAEWEYLRYTATVDTSVNTVRLGLGYKF